MEKTISQIRKEMQAATMEELPVFVSTYEKDRRAGAAELVARARKKLEAYEKEQERIGRMRVYEKQYEACHYICGIDEAGRGPLAGPVVAGAVILPKDCRILYLNDSKQLTAKKREELYDIIIEQAVSVGVGVVDHKQIDTVNILQATYGAMRRAVKGLSVKPDILLNDAVTIPGMDIRQVPIIKGDAKSISIAAASIVAKVTRDRIMIEYDSVYPGYGFAANKGYGSGEHIAALRAKGLCEIHRRSFTGKFISGEEEENLKCHSV